MAKGNSNNGMSRRIGCLQSYADALTYELMTTLGIAGSIITYSNINDMMIELSHSKLDHAVFKITNVPELEDVQSFVSQHALVFHSSHVVRIEEPVVYHVYDPPLIYRDAPFLFKIIKTLYEKSLGFFVSLAVIYGSLIFSIMGVHTLITGRTSMSFIANLFWSIVGLVVSFPPAEYFIQKHRLKPFVGYWKYFVYPTNEGNSQLQDRVQPYRPRLVEISDQSGYLRSTAGK